ncbi:M23 family metallopeptidase [Leptolyngbya sp. NK1-12]|jgi:murein DD-endopeptidase MepM/ murein hydrolase activator NlpD|nr:M23 family metallopeptidase [Leptolyngbya sp. NK1-12]
MTWAAMGRKIEVSCKFVLLLAGLGLSCTMPMSQHDQAQAVTQPTSAITEKPPTLTSNSERIQPAATDELSIQNQSEIRQVQPDQLPATRWQGSSFPVENLQAYTSAFGYRESPTGGYTQEFHYGLDMAAPEGSYVRNWWAGTVEEVSDNTACGTSVVVKSGDWTATYCHMQGAVESKNGHRFMLSGNVQIQEGQAIAAGARLGQVGMTGRTTGPHLHWTLKYAGNYVDPGYVLRAMYQAQQAQTAE